MLMRFVRNARIVGSIASRSCGCAHFYTAPVKDESLKTMRARLLYQSTKRGILECDILLGGFAKLYLEKLNEKQLAEYDHFINGGFVEWDIYYWLTDNKPVPDDLKTEVFDMMQKFTKSELTVHPNLKK